MKTTMRSAVLYGAKNIKIESTPIPELTSGMVLLKIKRAGICGSDLHYYEHGYCGSFVPSAPFILGHELTAIVVDVNKSKTMTIDYPAIGDRVTVNPAKSCGYCNYCKAGTPNLCKKTIMLGSGSTVPPTNGAFAEYIAVRADQCHLLPDSLSDSEGAMIEPLAVALQAIRQASGVSGKKVLVIGGGTIGLLTVSVAKAFGAAYVAVSDITQSRRETAIKLNADIAIDPSDTTTINQKYKEEFDIIFEASGDPQALRQGFELVKAGGTIVQIGTIGNEDVPLPANMLMIKQINFIGSFRYANIFDEAIRLIENGAIDLKPFLTDEFPIEESNHAMMIAGDKTNSLKVQLTL